jgi:hypothetical protein
MTVNEDELTDEGIEDIFADDDFYGSVGATKEKDTNVRVSDQDTSALPSASTHLTSPALVYLLLCHPIRLLRVRSPTVPSNRHFSRL